VTRLSLGNIAETIGAKLDGDANAQVRAVTSLNLATPEHISFLSSSKYLDDLKTTQALAVIVTEADSQYYSGNKLVMADPYLGFARVANLFAKESHPVAGVAPSAVIAASANISSTASIGHHAVIGEHCVIGDYVSIGANTVIGNNCQIGERTRIFANATILDDSIIGKRCIIHAGAVIGDDGFGFAPEHGQWLKIPQIGRVIIGDDVDIGSSTSIDRGALGDTVIGNGSKIDNLVQIAHNVYIGDHTAIAALVGIAGSAKIGKHCQIGGMTGIAGHIEIADNTRIFAKSMVAKSLKTGDYSSAWGVEKAGDWRRLVAQFKRLKKFRRKQS
jgi:UDP-3-O-[3-hydroxymyristoyl] glucosamine N-acyltransferase